MSSVDTPIPWTFGHHSVPARPHTTLHKTKKRGLGGGSGGGKGGTRPHTVLGAVSDSGSGSGGIAAQFRKSMGAVSDSGSGSGGIADQFRKSISQVKKQAREYSVPSRRGKKETPGEAKRRLQVSQYTAEESAYRLATNGLKKVGGSAALLGIRLCCCHCPVTRMPVLVCVRKTCAITLTPPLDCPCAPLCDLLSPAAIVTDSHTADIHENYRSLDM